jgi:hypothetical protein
LHAFLTYAKIIFFKKFIQEEEEKPAAKVDLKNVIQPIE